MIARGQCRMRSPDAHNDTQRGANELGCMLFDFTRLLALNAGDRKADLRMQLTDLPIRSITSLASQIITKQSAARNRYEIKAGSIGNNPRRQQISIGPLAMLIS